MTDNCFLWLKTSSSLQLIQTTEYMNQHKFIELYILQRKLSFIKLCTQVNLVDVQNVSSLLNKFEVWVSCEELCDVFVPLFLIYFFKNGIQPFATFAEYWI